MTTQILKTNSINYSEAERIDVPMRLIYKTMEVANKEALEVTNTTTSAASNSNGSYETDHDQGFNQESSVKILEILQHQKRQDELTAEHNNLLVRIVGVTDEVLREQLQETYLDIDDQLSLIAVHIKELNQQYMHIILDYIFKEHIEFYRVQFIEADVITCLEKTNNIEIRSFAAKQRLRLPVSLAQKRELCLIADAMNKKIILLDYEGVQIDYIGRGISEMCLYCAHFVRASDEFTTDVKTMYPKAVDL